MEEAHAWASGFERILCGGARDGRGAIACSLRRPVGPANRMWLLVLSMEEACTWETIQASIVPSATSWSLAWVPKAGALEPTAGPHRNVRMRGSSHTSTAPLHAMHYVFLCPTPPSMRVFPFGMCVSDPWPCPLSHRTADVAPRSHRKAGMARSTPPLGATLCCRGEYGGWGGTGHATHHETSHLVAPNGIASKATN